MNETYELVLKITLIPIGIISGIIILNQLVPIMSRFTKDKDSN